MAFRFFCFATFEKRSRDAWLAIVFIALSASASALETVTLQLKWHHAFQFAGYYAAQAKGYYREAGLEVVFREAGPGIDPVEAVLSGKAHYGVGTSSLLLARKAGHPVVVLGVVFQHSPLVLVAREASAANPIQDIRDFAGKRVMIEPQSDELIAFLKQEGVSLERLAQIPHSFDIQDLVAGRVDVMSAYLTNEPYYLERAGIRYQTYSPRMGGIDFYGDNLFTTESELEVHPERARAFREASWRGWLYAMEHPEEIADFILTNYPGRHQRDFYLSEARRMQPLLRSDLIEVGYMTRGRWRHIAETYANLGLLPHDYVLDGFLYEPNKHTDLTKVYVAIAVFLVFGAIIAYIYWIRRSLSAAAKELAQLKTQLGSLALFDPLTGLPSRRLFNDRYERVLAKVRREAGQGVLLLIRVDDFSSLVATPERDFAEQLFFSVGLRLQRCVRESDTLARYSSDCFAVLAGGLDPHPAHAKVLADGLVDRIRDCLLPPYRQPGDEEQGHSGYRIKFSLGLVLFDNLAIEEDVMTRAEAALSPGYLEESSEASRLL